jgi:hypothetical protein
MVHSTYHLSVEPEGHSWASLAGTLAAQPGGDILDVCELGPHPISRPRQGAFKVTTIDLPDSFPVGRASGTKSGAQPGEGLPNEDGTARG